MRVMVIVKGSPETEADASPGDEQMMRDMGRYNEELVKAGVMLAGEGLLPSAKGARVRFQGSKRTVIDGPFSEAKELVAGYWVWQVKSKEEAVEWLKKAPFQDGEVEIRVIASAEDFAAADPTGEIRKQEEELRRKIESRQSS